MEKHRRFRHKWIPMVISVLLTGGFVWLQLGETLFQPLINRLDYVAYDLRLRASLELKEPDTQHVAIVAVDEKSLQAEGRWPWQRDKLALLVDRLFDLGAVVVAFDVVFAEPEENSAQQLAMTLSQDETLNEANQQKIQALSSEFDHDKRLASSLKNRETVLSIILHNDKTKPEGLLPSSVIKVDNERNKWRAIPHLNTYTANLAILQQAASGAGFVTNFRDEDGVVRRSPLILRYGEHVYPAFALEVARQFLLSSSIQVNTAMEGLQAVIDSVVLEENRVPTDQFGQALIPYQGPDHTYPYVSATDVLSGDIDATLIENRIALIGVSALGLSDLMATPVARAFPGVEIHANLVTSILNESFPYEPSWAKGVTFLFLCAVGLGLALGLPFLGPLVQSLVGLATLLAVVVSNFAWWHYEGLALPLALPMLQVAVLGFFNLVYGFVSEVQSKRQIRAMFGQYVDPAHIDEMAMDPEGRYGFEGDSRQMSVLFADIRDFTSISEPLSAAELKDLLNAFFTPMTETIFIHRGTIDKYVGDMIMAFWGAPLENKAHAEDAVSAALSMLHVVEVLKETFKAKGYPPITMGVGINTGMMNVGDMGSTFRRSYTVLGDAVNLASRIEGLTKHYDVPLIVGEETQKQATSYLYRLLDKIKVKGKSKAVRIYQPLCKKDDASASLIETLNSYKMARNAYLNQDWVAARNAFQILAKKDSDNRLYAIYLERITALQKESLPKNWDGTVQMTIK